MLFRSAMRRDIEDSADIDAVDIYGLSEVMGPGVANECIESKDGPVIWEDHFYPEIVDPATGEVLPDGADGELVFTTLSKEALPVIRYRTRDLTRLLPPTARSMRRMGKIVGRSDDMLIIRGVNLFPTQVEELVLQQGQLSGQYQLVVTREALTPGKTSQRTCTSSSLPSRVTTSWYWPESWPWRSTISSICVGNRFTPRMISMSSLRPTILPMRRMLRAVGGSSRVRSRVR